MRCRPGGGYGFDPVPEVKQCRKTAGQTVVLGSALEN